MAYKILFFLFKGSVDVKEIGESLKSTRESMGISIEEAAEDLKTQVVTVLNIEEGDITGFQDISTLKYFIRDYAKYLGIKYEDIMDEFNEYLFDYTSKLSIDDIKKARKGMDKEEPKKITSPYTLEYKKKKYISVRLAVIIGVILLAALLIFMGYHFLGR